MRRPFLIVFLCIFLPGFLLSACSGPHPPSSGTLVGATQTAQQLTAAPSATPAPPTPTPEPLAATVNGVGIPLAAYQTSLAQLQKADTDLKKTATEADQRQRVLDDLIDQALLAQAAKADGYTLAESDLDARLAQMTTQAGGAEKLIAWESANGYNDASLREALRASLAASWERDRIIAQTPETADQVHAQQILVPDEATAQKALARLQAGVKFASIAFQYDPVAGGDLGWFPQGYLNAPEVEAAAFALQPGQMSEIIHSKLGYHIITVIERDPQHALSPDARLVLEQAALQKWFAEQRSKGKISVLVP
ncbi:MAG TPA: peptidylprolyl isomerase [Anaerolineaceae bacterium]|jgi:parvulin-like peptidyl-prolyl isomerase